MQKTNLPGFLTASLNSGVEEVWILNMLWAHNFVITCCDYTFFSLILFTYLFPIISSISLPHLDRQKLVIFCIGKMHVAEFYFVQEKSLKFLESKCLGFCIMDVILYDVILQQFLL